jgi:DNA repair exonuclease SbcCD ATPase subunit
VRITSLTLHDLRRYRDRQIDLDPGLTVVRGPNEAGKSTIQRAIELALTRKVTSTAGDLDALVSWDGGPDAHASVGMTFEYEGEAGEPMQGRLEKQFRGTRGQVSLQLGDEVITDPARVDEELANLSGVPTEAFFRSTASVRHHELAGLARDEAVLRDRLQASISGADRGTSQAKRALERALRGLQAQGLKNPGRLKAAADGVADVAARLDAGEAALGRLAADRDVLGQAHERRAAAEAVVTERRSLLERARQAERLVAEKAAAEERYERYRQGVIERDAILELERKHPSSIPLPALRQTVERLRTLETTETTLKAMLTGEVEVAFKVPAEVRWRHLSRLSILLVLVGVIGSAVAYELSATGLVPDAAVGAIPGIGVTAFGLLLALFGWLRRRRDKMSGQLAEFEVDRRLRGRPLIENDLRDAELEHADLLGRHGLKDLVTGEAELAAEEAHVAQIDQRRARLSGLVGSEADHNIAFVQQAAALQIEQKTAAIEAIGPIAKDPRAREKHEVEAAEAERALEQVRDEEAQARARLEQNTVDAEEVAGLAERLAMWTEELEILRRRERVYSATMREMVVAEQATIQTATRYLEQSMEADVALVTGGRYRRVRVDDTDLTIDVFSPEKQDWVSVSELSQGTLDVVYLAARLGLVRLVTGDRRPPLILDDPFVTLDDQRAPRALELLREIARDFQVIYLTTSDRYDPTADKVVELPGPTLADPGVPAEALAPQPR